jgi:hypothetical protein
MLIMLTTDFGTSDHFVGVMRGVILSIAPGARIVDITHGITPFDVNEAPFTIAQAWRRFPKGRIHVVVDLGVGTAWRPILVEAGVWRLTHRGRRNARWQRQDQRIIRIYADSGADEVAADCGQLGISGAVGEPGGGGGELGLRGGRYG